MKNGTRAYESNEDDEGDAGQIWLNKEIVKGYQTEDAKLELFQHLEDYFVAWREVAITSIGAQQIIVNLTWTKEFCVLIMR